MRSSDEQVDSLLAAYDLSKRGAFLRVLRDLQRFNDEQLGALIHLAHKVKKARGMLNEVVEEAETIMAGIPYVPRHKAKELGGPTPRPEFEKTQQN